MITVADEKDIRERQRERYMRLYGNRGSEEE
jgi:hypothetical protein